MEKKKLIHVDFSKKLVLRTDILNIKQAATADYELVGNVYKPKGENEDRNIDETEKSSTD